jgi:hypothetical protein
VIDCVPSVGTACVVDSIAARARGILERQRAGGTIQEVVAAMQDVVPGDLAPGDLGWKRVGGATVVVDFDLPRHSTFRIGASEGDGRRVRGVPAACRG